MRAFKNRHLPAALMGCLLAASSGFNAVLRAEELPSEQVKTSPGADTGGILLAASESMKSGKRETPEVPQSTRSPTSTKKAEAKSKPKAKSAVKPKAKATAEPQKPTEAKPKPEVSSEPSLLAAPSPAKTEEMALKPDIILFKLEEPADAGPR